MDVFRVDLNDTVIEDLAKSAASEQDSAPLLAADNAKDLMGGGSGGRGGGGGAPATASPSLAKVQGVRPGRAAASNSGWL